MVKWPNIETPKEISTFVWGYELFSVGANFCLWIRTRVSGYEPLSGVGEHWFVGTNIICLRVRNFVWGYKLNLSGGTTFSLWVRTLFVCGYERLSGGTNFSLWV